VLPIGMDKDIYWPTGLQRHWSLYGLYKRDLISDRQNKIPLLVPHTQGFIVLLWWCSFSGDYNLVPFKGPLPHPTFPICNCFKSYAISIINASYLSSHTLISSKNGSFF